MSKNETRLAQSSLKWETNKVTFIWNLQETIKNEVSFPYCCVIKLKYSFIKRFIAHLRNMEFNLRSKTYIIKIGAVFLGGIHPSPWTWPWPWPSPCPFFYFNHWNIWNMLSYYHWTLLLNMIWGRPKFCSELSRTSTYKISNVPFLQQLLNNRFNNK